jgi:PST family polysaccharide transporter
LTSGIYQSAFWLFISQDRSRELRNFAGTAAVINIASYLVGALWGVVGVAAAASLGFLLITTPLILFGASRSGPVRAADIVRCAAPFVAVGPVVYAVLLLDRAWLGLGGILQIVAATVLSYGLFVCLSLASKPNRQLMAGAFRSLKAMLPG